MKHVAVMAAACTYLLLAATPSPARASGPSPALVAAVLCIHSGWHYSPVRSNRTAPDYVLWHHGYWRTTDVPDGEPGGSGEGGWNTLSAESSGYAGGMSFTLGTYNSVPGPRARSLADIARATPTEQIRRALAVEAIAGNWSAWPETSRACGV